MILLLYMFTQIKISRKEFLWKNRLEHISIEIEHWKKKLPFRITGRFEISSIFKTFHLSHIPFFSYYIFYTSLVSLLILNPFWIITSSKRNLKCQIKACLKALSRGSGGFIHRQKCEQMSSNERLLLCHNCLFPLNQLQTEPL